MLHEPLKQRQTQPSVLCLFAFDDRRELEVVTHEDYVRGTLHTHIVRVDVCVCVFTHEDYVRGTLHAHTQCVLMCVCVYVCGHPRGLRERHPAHTHGVC